jgi:hypothetical protein
LILAVKQGGSPLQNKGLFILLSWLVAVAGMVIVSIILYHSGFRPGYPVYWAVLFALAAACALTGAAWGKASFLVSAPCFFLLGAASYYTVPLSGYGGTDARVAFWHCIGFSLLAAAGAMLLQRSRIKKSYPVIVALQTAVLVITIANLNPQHLRSIQHWGEPINVQHLSFDGGVSLPYVEGRTAYVLDGRRQLFKINLDAGEKEPVVVIPEPSAAEAGHPGLVIQSEYADYVCGRIIRSGEKELTVLYPYILSQTDDRGLTITVEYLLETVVNTEKGTTAWRLTSYILDTGYYLDPVYYNDFSISTGGPRGDTLVILGPEVETHIRPVGFIRWLEAGPGYFLAGTDNGSMYIMLISSSFSVALKDKQKEGFGIYLADSGELVLSDDHIKACHSIDHTLELNEDGIE